MVFLETVHLTLRNLREEDADIMHEYRNHPQCSRYQRGQTKTEEGIQQLIQNHMNDSVTIEHSWIAAIVEKQSSKLVGEVVVMPNEGTISLGYTISYRYHRKGYGYEALQALVAMLHSRYPAWDFICFVDPENRASRNLLQKLGFTDMGYLPSRTSQIYGKWTTPETEAEIAGAVGK